MATARRPDILREVREGSEVRFTYEFKGGESGYVSGHCTRALGNDADGITGIEVRVDQVRSKLPAGTAVPGDQLVKFALARITPDRETGLIIPLSKKERAERGLDA